MKIKLLVPALLLAVACGDNLHDTDDQTSFGSEDGAVPTDAPARAIEASIYIETPSCDGAIAAFEMDARYADDQSPLPITDYTCLWKFDDGTTSTDCAGQHEFADGGDHDFVLEVTHVATGETVEVMQRRFIYPPIEANLDVTTGDRTITWNATVNVGAEVHVFVEPAELLVDADPLYHTNRNYTVEVLRDGAYTVRMTVEDERGAGPICTAEIVKQVNVFCTGGEHTHAH